MKRIHVNGPIVSDSDRWFYEWFDMPATAPKDIVLPETSEPIEVVINSGGGDVYAGSEIYTKLRDYAGQVTVKVVGIAASAASVIAMAGDVVEISPTAQIMIHNVSTVVSGDHRDMLHEAGVLEGFNQSIANSYVAKTGMEMSALLDLMAKETWFTAQQAVEHGFADKVMFEDNTAPQLVASLENMVPSRVVARIAEIVHQKQEIDYDKLAEAVVSKMENTTVKEIVEEVREVPKGFGAFFNRK
ncbi:head maturation protease, ClpP-related [Streptococcus sp. ZY1909104]|uniref:head maturation protease, ClpP-related n=1 Tax=Streptococcus sp. ZY1909104 TaxID=3233335 RepID=UPI00349F638C